MSDRLTPPSTCHGKNLGGWGIWLMVFIICIISIILAVVIFKDMVYSTMLNVMLDGESEKSWYHVTPTQRPSSLARAGISFKAWRGLMDTYYSLSETCQD
jgi:hypothetical protein